MHRLIKPSFFHFTYFFIVITLFSYNSTALALSSDSKQPIEIEADQATFNESNSSIIYKHKIKLTQGSINILASELFLQQKKENNTNVLHYLSAQGTPVSFSQKLEYTEIPIKASAQSIKYNPSTQIVTLTGDAHLSKDGKIFEGAHIEYNMKSNTLSAQSSTNTKNIQYKNNRVKMIIPAPSMQE